MLAAAPIGRLQQHHMTAKPGGVRPVRTPDADITIQVDHFRSQCDGAAVHGMRLDCVLEAKRRRKCQCGAVNGEQLDLLRLARVVAQHCHE